MKSTLVFITGLFIGVSSFAVLHTTKTQADPAVATAFFTDVERGAYYDEPAEAMALKGIVTGYDDGRFAPNEPVTRGQVVTILHRYDRSVVQPLRKQIEKLRDLMDLGQCGDGRVQIGEECDDGGKIGGDGCSAECLKEEVPSVGPVPVPDENEDEDESSSAPSEATDDKEDEGVYEEEDERIFNRVRGNDDETDECKVKEQNLADIIRSSRACRIDDDCRLLVRSCGPFLTCGLPVNTANIGKVKIEVAGFVKECPEDRQVCALCTQRDVVCKLGRCRLDNPVTCTEEVRVCPDGSTVSRNSEFGCSFDSCPEVGEEVLEEKCAEFVRDDDNATYCATCGDGVCDTYERCTSSNCLGDICTSDCGGLHCESDCPSASQ